MYQNFIRVLFLIQFSLICLCHDGFRDVILSPKDFGGKYVKFNRLVEMTSSQIPWEEPLKESAKIALNSHPKLSKEAILRAKYLGMKVSNPQNAFGDIVIIAKGKLKKFENDTLLFEEIHDVCEFECQNNAEKYLENVTALWMVERIRHRDNLREYRYDLRFTIVPIEKNGPNRSKNLEERLRNQLKKTYILRDTDYPKYFQHIAPKAIRRVDHLDRNMHTIMHPNHFMHISFPQTPKHYQSAERLNIGEYMKKPFSMHKSPPMSTYYIPNVNNRYPIRFPDSRETHKNNPYRVQPIREEEKQETAQSVLNTVDHRGAVELNGKQKQIAKNINAQNKPQPSSTPSNIFVPQPAIALPIIVPQMPMGIVHVAPYTIPLHLQLSTPSNQILYSQPPDITTFRYPYGLINNNQQSIQQQSQQQQQYIPAFQYIPTSEISNNKTNVNINNFAPTKFKESEQIHKGQSFSLPDPIYHPTTTEKFIKSTQYTPKVNNYATAASIQINSYENSGDFLPINPPHHHISKSKKTHESKHSTTEKSKFSNNKNYESTNRNRQNVKERVSRPITTTPSPPTFPTIQTTSYLTSTSFTKSSTNTSTPTTSLAPHTEFQRNHQFHETNYENIAVTRPSVTKRTTEKPFLKWLPKKHRNKTFSSVTSYTAYPIKNITKLTTAPSNSLAVTSSSIEASSTASSQSNIHPTIKAFTHVQVFRGRNRFYNNRRNSSTPSSVTTEKSTTAAVLSSTIMNQALKLLKRKATTTTIPITTEQPVTTTESSFMTTYVTSPSLLSYDETNEPISYSTAISMEEDNEGERRETTIASSSYELIPAGVEAIDTKSSNIQLYKASVLPEINGVDEIEKLKIDEIATSIIRNHAKSTESEQVK
ncbi:hypothetical protein PVAND_003959 [Polypedilum vanderplanki]|uniref:Uncharacterized protein n=1 Tax=Polypedilum vanderplanki TaxID=319348 RepID=A0A9J6BWQ1_POLVA|nr:hypothetical protein PVAND_003959 [Polypedilum vanderplanki]